MSLVKRIVQPGIRGLALPGVEIRIVRVVVIVALVAATIWAGYLILKMREPIVQENKLEVGMVLGWLIAKAGTAVDWLLGSSESGNRRADAAMQRAAQAPPEGSKQVTAGPDAKLHAEAETPSDTAGSWPIGEDRPQ